MLDCDSHLAGIDEGMVVRSAASNIQAFVVLNAGHLDSVSVIQKLYWQWLEKMSKVDKKPQELECLRGTEGAGRC